jgi:hypothetical protein
MSLAIKSPIILSGQLIRPLALVGLGCLMSKINHERFRHRKVYEPEVPVEFQERPQGPSKADLRAQAAQAMAEYRKPVSKGMVEPPEADLP